MRIEWTKYNGDETLSLEENYSTVRVAVNGVEFNVNRSEFLRAVTAIGPNES